MHIFKVENVPQFLNLKKYNVYKNKQMIDSKTSFVLTGVKVS